jgi:hypothetical protein
MSAVTDTPVVKLAPVEDWAPKANHIKSAGAAVTAALNESADSTAFLSPVILESSILRLMVATSRPPEIPSAVYAERGFAALVKLAEVPTELSAFI